MSIEIQTYEWALKSSHLNEHWNPVIWLSIEIQTSEWALKSSHLTEHWKGYKKKSAPPATASRTPMFIQKAFGYFNENMFYLNCVLLVYYTFLELEWYSKTWQQKETFKHDEFVGAKSPKTSLTLVELMCFFQGWALRSFPFCTLRSFPF